MPGPAIEAMPAELPASKFLGGATGISRQLRVHSGFRQSLEERMFRAIPIRAVPIAALFVSLLWVGTAAQNANAVVAAASKAMGVDNLKSITYSGTARNGAFGQSKAIGDPMGPVNVTQITQLHPDDHVRTGRRPDGAGLAGHRADAAANGAGRAGTDAGRVQPEHHRHAGRQQLEPGAQHLDDAVGLPEGRGGQQRDRRASRAASRWCRFRPPTSSRRRDSPTW